MELIFKKCSKCKEDLEVSFFNIRRKSSSGYQSQCRSCTKASKKTFMGEHRDRVNSQMKEYRQALKDSVFEAYGGYCCVCCGESRKVFLCLDHVGNDGYIYRKITRSSIEHHLWLRKNNYPPILQVLCYNCNNAKRFGECPHTLEEET